MFLFQSSQEKKLKQDAKNQMQICLRSFDQRSQDKYKKSMQFLSKHIQNNNQDIIEIVVDNVKATIKDDELPPVRKYQAIRLLRDLMKIQIKNKNKTLGKYVLKKIFKRLVILAAHNAGSNDQDRGKDIFKGVKKDQEKYSILFLNELLLSIEEWAKTWPGVSQGMKKQFNEAYKQLLTNGVKFPKQIVKGPQPQAYRGEDGNRNSLSAYSSVPKKQSFSKNDQKSPMRSVSVDQKQKKVSTQSVNQSIGKLNEKNVKNYFKQIIPPVQEFISILNEMQSGDDPEILAFLNDMIQQLRNVISTGNAFCTQLSQEQMKSDYLGKGVILALDYSQGASKDIKKLLKSNSQFSKFKAKYLKLGNQLIKGLKGILNNQRNSTSIIAEKSKPERSMEMEKSQIKQPITKINQQEPSSAKKLSVPRVSAQNMYSSSSGQPNNWVIKQRSQYNSNSNKEQVQVHQKFGSFGIGGIGQKIKNQSKEKQKSNFSDKAATQRPSSKIQVNQFQDKKIQTYKELPASRQNQNNNGQRQNNKENTFGSFKINSDQNSKPQSNFQQSHPSFQKAEGKKRVQEVKDIFNQSGFQRQQKVQIPIQEKNSSLQQSGNFFGQFGNEKPIDGLPRGNRNQRKNRTGPTTRQFQPNDDPFQNNMNSQIGNQSQTYSGFNENKPSISGNKSQSKVLDNSKSQFKPKNQNQNSFESDSRKKSFDDPFANSFQLNKSNRNSYDDKNPNFWEGEPSKNSMGNNFQTEFPKRRNSQIMNDSQNFTNNQVRSKIQNPFQNPQFSKRASKSINPFQDDSKSQVSQKNRSSVLNFEMNKTFTKSQMQNPFENPFQTTSQNLSRTNEQPSNPFQTSKDEFKPPKQPQKYDSVSQQGSFKKVNIPQSKGKNISIENPFETMTQNKSEIYEPKQIDQSWKFSIKDKQSNQGFDFDQFQNVPGPQRNSVDTSSFPAIRESFNPIGSQKKIVDKKRISTQIAAQNQNQKSIHFSQFGDQTDFNNRSVQVAQKQGSKKSFNFSDFGGFQDKPKSKNSFAQFSGFNDQNIQVKKQELNAFQMSKHQGSDFFKQTQKSHRIDKPQDNKSQSGFSGFNINGDIKSQQNNKSQVDWEDFGKFQRSKEGSNLKLGDNQRGSLEFSKRKQDQSNVFGTAIDTQRYQEESRGMNNFIDKNQLRLQFSQNTSKYHSPQFNQKFDTVSQNQQDSQFDMMNSLKKVDNQEKQGGESIKFEEFIPLQKKGYAWNPLGLKPERDLSKIMICTDYDIEQKKKEVQYYERMYNQEKELIQKAKQLYNQARKVYLQKIGKIDNIIKQKQTYRQILTSLKQSNGNKQEEIFLLNEKIKQISQLKEKILQKEKLFFQKTKNVARQNDLKNINIRTNNNKWEIFNRNLKMMRQKQLEQNVVNFSKTGFSYTRY